MMFKSYWIGLLCMTFVSIPVWAGSQVSGAMIQTVSGLVEADTERLEAIPEQ